MNVMNEIYYEYVLSLKMAFSLNMQLNITYTYSCVLGLFFICFI